MIVLVDDLRNFKDGREAKVARTSREAFKILQELGDGTIDELWLDHDLGMLDGETDDTRSLVYELEEKAFNGKPYKIAMIYVHTSNGPAGEALTRGLKARGYSVRRVWAGDYFN